MIGELGEFKFRYAAKSPIFPFKIRVSRLLLDKGPVPLSARSALTPLQRVARSIGHR